MRLSIKLDLHTLVSTSFSDVFYLDFTNIKDMNHWYADENVTELEFNQGSNNKTMYVFLDDDDSPTYDEQDGNIVDLSDNDEYITFTCDIADSSLSRVIEFIEKGIIELNQNGKTSLILYRLNDEKDKLNKSLIPVTIIEGTFKAPLGIKNIELDVINYNIDDSYNYVYIPILKRYYYITNIQLINKDYTRLILQEDVLMSWKELIKLQNAFVTRSEEVYNEKIVDERYPLENNKSVRYESLEKTAIGNLENIELAGSFTANASNFLVSVNNDVEYTKTTLIAPSSNLPNISPVQSTYNVVYFLRLSHMNRLMKAIINESNMASSINAIIFLPFVPTNAFSVSYSNPLMIGLPTSKGLCDDNQFHYIYDLPSGVNLIQDIGRTPLGTSPYLILADFQFPTLTNWLNLEPYRVYELYIPFVGWIKLDSLQLSDKRLLIYYTIDFQTGNGTAYLYNYTDSKIVYSCNCQLGVKLDILSSNALELSREKEANQLNTLLGLISSAVSIGVGVASENPVAVVGGVLSASKTIANAVNKNRTMFERGQVTYGSGDAGLHSDLRPRLRITYYLPVFISTAENNIYYHLQGRPCNKYMDLNNIVSGYVEIGDIHFDAKGYNIYNDEISEIVQLLKNGVIF